ncbi:MAG TPA: DUF1588 domain-containing protein [Polyangiaceae bacterium]|nr:DUF1588 domain-containing protein [Polyangiaceae bacterium]
MTKALTATVVLALGCTGVIEGTSSGPGQGQGPGQGPAGGGNTAIDDDQDAIDDDLQAENPELFEIALTYFPGTDIAPSKKRIFRLTRTQLELTGQTVLPEHTGQSAVDHLPRDPLEKNYEYAANLDFNAANFTPFVDWITERVESVRATPASVIDCAESDAACLDEQARAFVSRAFRGVTSEELLTRYADFFSASIAEVGLANAVADLVDVTLSSPGFAFRDEVQTSADSLLLPAQLAQNLSYTLADAPPEAVGLAAIAPDEVTAAADQVLATPLARAKLMRFINAWLEVKEPDEFDIATSIFPEFTPELATAIVAETESFLEQQLGTSAPKLKDLTEVTQPFGAGLLASTYDAGSDQRLGIFTQPAVIASHSGPTTTRLVKRGVFFVRKVMCMQLGVPPEGVDTTLPEEREGTLRQQIESVTTPATCAGCHSYINPFGFMQENFDAIGRYRTEDNGLPVDASISVDFLDEGPLTTNTAADALRGFTSSLRFQQCFTRQLFRFYNGRDEEPGDDPVLRQMFFNFANEGEQDIVKLLHTLASSSTFSRRSEVP